MTNRQRIERLRDNTGYDELDADIAAALALIDEWEKGLKLGRFLDTEKALSLLDKESL